MIIRPAVPEDGEAISRVITPAIRAGETYALPPDWTEAEALAYWGSPGHTVFVAQDGGEDGERGTIVGTYYIRPNQRGSGDHVANCAFMTATSATGRGVARAMCGHALQYAAAAGYAAMQFNFVVSTNTRAVALWQGLGFEIVGRLPAAFRHPTLGLVDALVMYRKL
jgi:ribosomal protein S18 acetylase RimI-like enzyme